MKSENKTRLTSTEKFILTLYGLMVACSLFFLFRPECDYATTTGDYDGKKVKQMTKEVKEQKGKYEKRIVQLEKRNLLLKHLLKRTNEQLDKADKTTRYLNSRINLYADSVQNDSLILPDSPCDSLRIYTLEYVEQTHGKENILNHKIHLLNEAALNRDSALFSCSATLRIIDSTFLILSQRHSELASQLLQTQKNLRRSKRQTRLWSAASLLISGVAITLWIKNH